MLHRINKANDFPRFVPFNFGGIAKLLQDPSRKLLPCGFTFSDLLKPSLHFGSHRLARVTITRLWHASWIRHVTIKLVVYFVAARLLQPCVLADTRLPLCAIMPFRRRQLFACTWAYTFVQCAMLPPWPHHGCCLVWVSLCSLPSM